MKRTLCVLMSICMLLGTMVFATDVYAAKDKTKPTIKYTLDPDKDTYTVDERVNINFVFTDKVELGSYEVTMSDGNKFSANIAAGKTEERVKLTTNPLKEDLKVTCTLKDAAGNKQTKNFTLECRDTKTPPVITLSLPDGDNHDVGEKVTVKVKITDETKLKKYEISHNGETDSYNTTKNVNKDYKFVAAAGLNIITVTAWDSDGNSSEKTITFNGEKDTEKPVISTTTISPNKASYEEGESIKVKVGCTDNRGIGKIEIYNGDEKKTYTDAKGTSHSKEYSIKAKVGSPTIVRVYVYDNAGNVAISQTGYQCKKADKAPEIKSASLDKTKYEEDEMVTISFKFSDDTGLASYTVTHDGAYVANNKPINGASYSGTEHVYAKYKKDVEIVITVRDTSGKEKSKTLKYSGGPVDAAPVITDISLSPDKDEYEEGDKITVNIKAKDETKLSKFVLYHDDKEKKGTISGKNGTAKMSIDAVPGSNVPITVVVYDNTGNTCEETVYYDCVEVDNEPKVKVTLDPNKKIYREGEYITVNVTLTDDKGLSNCKVYINGYYSSANSADCYGIKSKSFSFSVRAEDGDNEISVYANDTGDQTTSKTVEFEGSRYGGNPPSASFSVSPYKQTYNAGDEVTVTISMTDDMELSYYEAKLNGERLGGRSISGKLKDVEYTVVLKKGNNNIVVNVTDGEGHEKSFYHTINAQAKVTNKAPEVTISGFTANYTYGERINLELHFTDDTGLSEYSVYNGSTTVASSWPLAGKSSTEKVSFDAREGYNRIMITVTDKDGEVTTVYKDYTGHNDTTPPEITVSGLGASYTAGSDIAFNVTLSDNRALSKYDIYHNNKWVKGGTVSGTVATIPVSGVIRAGENKCSIEIRAYDTNNNEYFKICSYTGITDTQKPTVEVRGLNSIYDTDVVAGFSMVFTDNEGVSKYEIIVDGVTVKTEPISGTYVTKEYSFNAKEGNHSIVIKVYDTRGNVSAYEAGYRGDTDNVLPLLTISGNENYYDPGATASLELTMTDDRQLDRFEVIRGNEEILAEGTLNGLRAVKDITFTVAAGKNDLTFKVWDKSGNMYEITTWCRGRTDDEETEPAPGVDDVVEGTPIYNTNNEAVTVSIPQFKIYINEKKVKNFYLKYPYIVYNNITYFPMTYHGSRFLGLAANWTSESGLKVGKLGIRSEGENENTEKDTLNEGTYTAYRTTGYIIVNGKYIDNSAEPYPLLNFNDVTYFPLTWRFTVDEFGWENSFTPANGLVINSR